MKSKYAHHSAAESMLIRTAVPVTPASDDLYPPWQGMQYLHDMFGGRAKLADSGPGADARHATGVWPSSRSVTRRCALSGS